MSLGLLITIGEISELSNFELTLKAHIYRFNSSVGRGDFKIVINVEKVIRGSITDFKI
jgi:hypothetical protein